MRSPEADRSLKSHASRYAALTALRNRLGTSNIRELLRIPLIMCFSVILAHFHLPFCARQRVEERQPPTSEFLRVLSGLDTRACRKRLALKTPQRRMSRSRNHCQWNAIMVAAERCKLRIRTGEMNPTTYREYVSTGDADVASTFTIRSTGILASDAAELSC